MIKNKNRLKGITFFIDGHIHEKLVKAATDADRPLSHIVRGMIRSLINGKGGVSQRRPDTEREAIIQEILNTDFGTFSPEAIQDLRRVNDEAIREITEGLAALCQGGKV